MVTGWLGRLQGGRTRDGGAGILINTAREIVGRRRSLQGGLNEVRHPSVLDALSESDFAFLDVTVAERVNSDREFATVLARLTHHAARSKGFDRQTVDSALRLEPLLPADDPNREREKLLRDAYAAAQRSGYIRGGRQTLARLAQRFLESGDTERARALFKQELEITGEEHDTETEVDVAIQLGDLCRRDADTSTAVELYRRAGRSAQRLDYSRGIAEALQRQTEMLPPGTSVETRAAMQRQALDAAQKTLDRVLESKIAAGLADSLSRGGKPEDAVDQLVSGLRIAREIGDLSLESRCLTALAKAERRLGQWAGAAEYERDLLALEERLGNRPAAAEVAVNLGSSLLSLGNTGGALDAYERAHSLSLALGDLALEQRALGGLGVTHAALGHATEALDHLNRALQLAQRSNDLPREAQWLASLAQTMWTFGQEDEAIQSALDSLEIARRIEDWTSRRRCSRCSDGSTPPPSRRPGRERTLAGRSICTGDWISRAKSSRSCLPWPTWRSSPGRPSRPRRCTPKPSGSPPNATITVRSPSSTGSWAASPSAGARSPRDSIISAAPSNTPVRRAAPHCLSKAVQHYAAALHAANDPEAIEAYQIAIAQTRDLNDVSGEALMRLNLGTLLTSQGNLDEGMESSLRRLRPRPECRRKWLGPAPAHRVGYREHRSAAVSGRTSTPPSKQ